MRTTLRRVGGLLLLTVAFSACSSADAKKQQHLRAGDEAFAKGEYPRAVIEYKNAVKADQKSAEARKKLGESHLRTGDHKRAAAEFLRAADLEPNDLDLQVVAGNGLLVAGAFEDAKTRAEQVLKQQPKHPGAQILLGYALAGLRDTNGAVKELQAAVQSPGAHANVYINLGTLQLAQGARAQAEAAFKTAVANSPNSAEPQIALANFYLADGKVAEAEGILRKAIEIKPPSADASRTLGDLLAGTGRLDEAEPHYVAAVATSKDVTHRLALGDYYMSKNAIQKARETLEGLTANRLTSAEALARLARLDFAEGKRDAAYARLETVLKAEAKNPLALAVKGEFLLADRRAADANAAFKAAVAADPKFVRAQYGLGLSYLGVLDAASAEKAFAETLKLSPRFAPAQVELGRLRLAAGQSATALQHATSAVENAPTSGQARLLRAQALLARGDVATAQRETDALVAALPNWDLAHTQMGTVQLARGNTAVAKASFERAAQLSPQALEPLRGLVLIDRRAGNFTSAHQRIAARLAKDPNNPSLLVLAADVYDQQKDKAKLESTLKRLVELDPSNLRAYNRLGELYVQERRLDEALATFTTASLKKPDASGPRTMLGFIHHIQGRIEDAVKAYEAAVGLDRNAAVASNNLAWIYAEKGENLDRALALAQAAKQRLPDSPEIADTLGWVYYKKDMAHLAIEAFQQSARIDPKRADYQFHLGLAYIKRGESARAREALQRALTLQGDFPGADDARRALATLER